jgi:flagellar basal-body rod protein FlgF
MSEAMYVAASGTLVNQIRMEVLANNLSNVNTVGFKEDRSVFRAYLPSSSDSIGGDYPGTLSTGGPGFFPSYLASNFHLAFEGTQTNFSPGQLKFTGNALDLGLEGDGFFCIKTQEGTQYTRKGNFTFNSEGVLATQEGLPVLGEGGEIKVDGTDVSIDTEGNVSVDGKQAGTIKIVDFSDSRALKKVGNTLFAPADPDIIEEAAEGVKINQGFIELSNVDGLRVMTEMIEVLRAYESYKKVIQSVDDATSKAINDVGSVK